MRNVVLSAMCVVAVMAFMPKAAAADVYEYADLWWGDVDTDGNIQLYASGSIGEISCSDVPVEAVNILKDPVGNVVDQASQPGWCDATAYTDMIIMWDTAEEYSEGEYESTVEGYVNYQFYGCARRGRMFGRYQARYEYSHFNALIDKHEYVRRPDCVGRCQGPKYCSTSQYNWLHIKGWYISTPMGSVATCIPSPPYPRGTNVKPGCKSPAFGTPIWAEDECI